jgi:hypothetical protein
MVRFKRAIQDMGLLLVGKLVVIIVTSMFFTGNWLVFSVGMLVNYIVMTKFVYGELWQLVPGYLTFGTITLAYLVGRIYDNQWIAWVALSIGAVFLQYLNKQQRE